MDVEIPVLPWKKMGGEPPLAELWTRLRSDMKWHINNLHPQCWQMNTGNARIPSKCRSFPEITAVTNDWDYKISPLVLFHWAMKALQWRFAGFQGYPGYLFFLLAMAWQAWVKGGWGDGGAGFICGVGVNGSYSCQGHKSILVGLGGWHWHLSDTSLHLPTCSVSNRLHKRELIGRWWQTSRAQFAVLWRRPIPSCTGAPQSHARTWDTEITLYSRSCSESHHSQTHTWGNPLTKYFMNTPLFISFGTD